ncbi:TonB-dependent receptor [Sphingomonas sp. Leaf343]|uniref:TonB-dependent receptor n=1 Tax=Sphingomonas sp. Leaf343 TaxID=1736345 RepID=UPI0009EB0C7E|nr:TonB-dependent receptor [Sphingomonas sp. Leaf343]
MNVDAEWLFRASMTSLIVGLVAFPVGAAGQSATWDAAGQGAVSNTDQSDDDIVVTGIRSGIERAVKLKRDADSIVDVISAEDIGRFPDVNVAESVQRISGVQINRTRGEGRSVNIRGLPDTFTLVTLNGRSVPNAINDLFTTFSRSFDFSALPSEFVRTLEVYKSPTADLDDGGLAGTVNIRTPRPLDIDRRVLAFSAQAEHESNSGKTSPRISGLFADSFLDGRLGITLGGSYTQRRPQTHQIETGWNTVTEGQGVPLGGGSDDLNGDGLVTPNRLVRIPGLIIHDMFTEDNRRLSGLASVQFRASDAFEVYVDGFYTKVDVGAVRQENYQNFANASGVIVSRTEMLDGVETATDFTVANLDLRNGGRYQNRDGYIRSLVGGAKFQADAWTIVVEGSAQRSRQRRDTLNIADSINGTARIIARPGDDIPGITYLDGFDARKLDPANFRLLSLNGELNRVTNDRMWDAKLDIRRDFGERGLTTVRAGAKYVDRSLYQDNKTLTISAAGVSQLYGGLPAGPIVGSFSAAPFMIPIAPGAGSFLGSYDGNAAYPSRWLGSDARSFVKRFSDTQLTAAGTYTNDATGILNVDEQTLALYARGDIAFGKLTGNIGFRAVRTGQNTVGVSPDLNGITVEVETGMITRVPASAALAVKRSYWDYLPSVNLKYEATDTLQFRLSASRTITRPNLGDISPTTTANGNALTVTRNNPYLDPFRANNIDATIEYYFGRDALVGASLFYKNLESLIRRETSIQSLPVSYIRTTGTTTIQTDFTVSELVNGSGVDLKGVELYFQQAFTWLPSPLDGFGTILNYTYIDNSDPTQLTAASKHNYNVIGYYEKGPVGARLSYSWRSSYLAAAAVSPAMGRINRAFGTLDGSISLKVAPRISIVIEGVNLLDRDEIVEYTTGLPANYLDAGRRVFGGVRVSF